MPLFLGPQGVRPSRLRILRRDPAAHLTHETVERKGRGHPDTLADTLALRISRAYARYTREHCEGLILHHQIDKLMVLGGRTELSWGGGRFVEPVTVIVAGRVSRTWKGRALPVTELVTETVRDLFRELFPMLDLERDLVIEDRLTTHPGPGTLRESQGAIAHMFEPVSKETVRGYEKLVANDTSYCVAHAPLTRLEAAVLELERTVTSDGLRQRFPWLGCDVKVMAWRSPEGEIDVTACVPQIAAHVPNLSAYRANLETIGALMLEQLGRSFGPEQVTLSLNTKDDYERHNVYLTVSGASLSGDIGAVGRGNRVHGLITSSRPMSLEGYAGKNPRYYSGFVYSMLTERAAHRIAAETGHACEVEVISQNGAPLLEPWRVTVTTPADPVRTEALMRDELARIPELTEHFLNGPDWRP
ncbi:methionine adenosyltransferase [Hyalangium rubrum]|uniref:Methionine adenosyltransferase n=1 Tax=Hyalangium rubrum TaxID=3103134 RepID=A0ABU5H8T3_9BACT|nr:methionine adenosyltransferase [Hyalangium sp. s54d21]MDY7229494.1 methionine adenosyltransferase [Hyalangium sp. s54d21]